MRPTNMYTIHIPVYIFTYNIFLHFLKAGISLNIILVIFFIDQENGDSVAKYEKVDNYVETIPGLEKRGKKQCGYVKSRLYLA